MSNIVVHVSLFFSKKVTHTLNSIIVRGGTHEEKNCTCNSLFKTFPKMYFVTIKEI